MSGTVSLRSVHGPFKSHGNNASSLMWFIHVVAAQASPEEGLEHRTGYAFITTSVEGTSRSIDLVLL